MDTIRNLPINFAVFLWLVSYAPQGALWASGEFSKTAPAELLACHPGYYHDLVRTEMQASAQLAFQAYSKHRSIDSK